MSEALQARYVYPVDRPPIENGVVAFEGGRIVSVGPKVRGQAVRDLGEVALLPGFVNAHTHLEFSHLRRPLGRPGAPLADWIRLVIAERGRGDATIETAISTGIRESLMAGVTTLGEIVTAPWQAYLGAVRPRLTLFAEVIGFSQARAESAFASVSERLAAATRGTDLEFGISPHAPYTVSLTLLTRLVDHARRYDFPVAMHLAESLEELEFLKTGRGPFQELLEERSMWDGTSVPAFTRPLEYLQLMGRAPRSLVIHGNYLDAAEQELLAESADHMSLVYCPRTHSYFQHEPYPLAELLMRGVRVALGTDSRASNPDLNFIAEIREAMQKHRAVAPQRILEMATLAGAAAIGRATEIGSLGPGKSADFVALSLPPHRSESADEQLITMFSSNQRPAGVWLRGVEIEITADSE